VAATGTATLPWYKRIEANASDGANLANDSRKEIAVMYGLIYALFP